MADNLSDNFSQGLALSTFLSDMGDTLSDNFIHNSVLSTFLSKMADRMIKYQAILGFYRRWATEWSIYRTEITHFSLSYRTCPITCPLKAMNMDLFYAFYRTNSLTNPKISPIFALLSDMSDNVSDN